MEEKFAVAFAAEDWGFDALDRIASQFFNSARYFFHGSLLDFGIADDSAFAHLLASRLELRLDQDNGFELAP